jgi:uncharacterized membrane protein YhaH (DUF805 family)
MNFLQATKSGFKKSIEFSGRASRSEYWYFFIAFIIIQQILAVTLGLALGIILENEQANSEISTDIIFTLFFAILSIPIISAFVRRLHDIDLNGRWILVVFIPIIGAIFWLICACKKGTEGDNRFGKNPIAKEL